MTMLLERWPWCWLGDNSNSRAVAELLIAELLIIVTPDFYGGCDGHGWTRQGTSAAARSGQDSGRFGKDGRNE